MRSFRYVLLFIIICFYNIYSQTEESPFKAFGFFQTQFTHQTESGASRGNSFSTQQLNLFLQKDLAKDWSSLVNLEFLNNYSSNKMWGAFNLEEAWVRYYANQSLNLKIGLQIPIFNNLNEINNRTPILPYIIRPLAYETSFSEFIDVEGFLPKRTYLQLYGFIPAGKWKFDYAFFIGNSPNIATYESHSPNGQSGIDTTDFFLVGGRLGLRFKELKLGVSVTQDRIIDYNYLGTRIELPPESIDGLRRIRLGGDLSLHLWNFDLEGEIIEVFFDDDSKDFNMDKKFYYSTLGYHINEKLFAYLSYWYTNEKLFSGVSNVNTAVKVTVPTAGLSYDLLDRLRLKAQFGAVKVTIANIPEGDVKFNYHSLAVSVFF